MVEFSQLKVFLLVVQNLSFTEAARHLHVSQPTVSRAIRSLEQELDVTLFDRHGSKAQLTDAGCLLIPWARKLILQSNEMKVMMSSLQTELVGELRIACSTSAGKYILPRLAARLNSRHPGVSIAILTCTQERIVPRLLDGEAHLGVVSTEVCDSGLECQDFFTDRITLIVPSGHPWASRQSIEPSELLEEKIIMREPTSGTRKEMLKGLAAHDIGLGDLRVILEVGNAEAIVNTVADGYGVSFVSRLVSAAWRERGFVVEVPVEALDLKRQINIIRRELETPNRVQEVFWGFLHDPNNTDLYLL